MENNFEKNLNHKQDGKNNIKMNDFVEKTHKQNNKHYKKIKKFNSKNSRNKIFFLIFLIILLSIFILPFNSLKFCLSLTKEIKKYKNIQPLGTKNKIITIGFYDVIYCDPRWIRVKKGYFYEFIIICGNL